MANKLCKDCGILFQSVPDLFRHQDKHCPERRKRKLEIIADNEGFQKLIERARKLNAGEFNKMMKKYIKKGLNKNKARRQVEKDLIENDFNVFLMLYKQLLSYIVRLQSSQLHMDIIDEIMELINHRRTVKSAINRVIKREHFSELFELAETDETSGSSDSEEEMEANDSNDNEDSNDGFSSEDNIPLSELVK